MRDCRVDGHVYVIDDEDNRCLVCAKPLDRGDNITKFVRKHRWRGEMACEQDMARQPEWGAAG